MLSLAELVTSAMTSIKKSSNIAELDCIRVEYLGRKGRLTIKMSTLREIPTENRPVIGALINKAKKKIQQALKARKIELENADLNARLEQKKIDVSLPGRRIEIGSLHPITRTIYRIERFFNDLGFITTTGPEIEDSYYNFDALNIPRHHPARDNRDTFWFDSTRLLRTQTSAVQIRTMERHSPPIRIISSGRVYRNDYDQTHSPMFHQMEGLIIDQKISFSNLKGTLCDFLVNFFEEDLQIRFRPSYFPFTKLSAEVDIISKNGDWLEVLGCGLVHPSVLRNVGIDPEIYSGFAFGIGIERLAMLRYSIVDLRIFLGNDLRFLKQFK